MSGTNVIEQAYLQVTDAYRQAHSLPRRNRICPVCDRSWSQTMSVTARDTDCCSADCMHEMEQRCERCNGTGQIDTPYSGSDPCCPECDGEGK